MIQDVIGLSSAADGGDDRDLGGFQQLSGEASGVADVFVADEDVDVLAHLALLVDDAIANAWVNRPESDQGIRDGSVDEGDFDGGTSGGKFAQGSRDVEGDGQSYLLLVGRDVDCRDMDRRDFLLLAGFNSDFE